MQIGSLSALDLLPTENEGAAPLQKLLRSYLIACKVEGKSPNTLTIYSRVIGYFTQFVQDSDVTHITAQHIRLFLLSYHDKCLPNGRKLTSATVNAYYRALKTFFNWLVAEGFLTKSPMQNIKPPKVDKKIIRPFSPKDIEDILLLCSGNKFLDLRNRSIVLLFMDTGLRLEELSNIQLKDINFDQETIKVMGKGAKERIVRMGKSTQKAMVKYLLKRDDSYTCLWVTEERKPIRRAGIQITVKRLCQRAEITDAKPGPHTFRHYAAISCLRNGMNVFTLQEMLGHASLEMTRRYTKTLGAEDVIEAHKTASPVDMLKLK